MALTILTVIAFTKLNASNFCNGVWLISWLKLSGEKSILTHTPSGRRLSYGQVAVAASKLPSPDPKSMQLKDPKDWKIAGKPLARLDTADKLTGKMVYTTDVKLPGMLNATIKDAPVYRTKI